MPVFDVDAYVQSLKTKYNIADEDLKDITQIKAGFMRQDDYSRNQQQLQQERQSVQATYDQLVGYENWIRSLEAKYGQREHWDAAFAQSVANQNPDGSNRMTQSGLTAADVQKMVTDALAQQEQTFRTQLETVGQGAAAFSKFYFNANKKWEKEYGAELPEEEFQKFYTENGHTNPAIALSLFEQPFKAAKEKKEYEQKIEQARLEGIATGRSQAGTPDGGAGGGWMVGDQSISLGAAATVAANQADAAAGVLTRDQALAKFNAGMEKRAQSTNNFQSESK